MPRHCLEPSPPILVGAPCRGAAANAGGSIRKRRFGRDDGRNERKRTKENVGSETPTDASRILPGLTGPAAPGAPGAHLSAFHHGSRPKESFIARDSASGQASWDVAGHVLRIPLSGRYPPLPIPVQRQHLALRS